MIINLREYKKYKPIYIPKPTEPCQIQSYVDGIIKLNNKKVK